MKNSFEVDKDRDRERSAGLPPSRGQSLTKYTKTATNGNIIIREFLLIFKGFNIHAFDSQYQSTRSKIFTPDRKRLTVDDLK